MALTKLKEKKKQDALAAAIASITTVMQRYALDARVAGESGKTPQEEFLALVNEFCVDWKKAREDNVRAARMIEKMKARNEAQKREAMQKDEKRKRLMMAGKSSAHLEAAAAVEDIMSDMRQSSEKLTRSFTTKTLK